MPKAVPIQNAFNAGEWSWPMYGRTDLPKYYNAVRRMRNIFPKVQGPAVRRGGTMHVVAAHSASVAPALIPFEFGITQAYVLEFGNLVFRIFRDNGIVTSSGSPVEVVTTYATADIADLKWAQSADTLYLVHPSYPPRKVTRTSHTAWSITTIEFSDGPYLPVNTTSTTLGLSGTSGSVTVTASATTGINDDTGFQTTDVNRLIRWKDPAGNWTWLKITARSSTTVVTATISGDNASATTATANWRLGSWSDTTGYPRTVTFFQDRLCFGGEPSQRIDMSSTGDYENFRPTAPDETVVGDDAIGITLNANNVNVIRWLADDEKALICGTVGGEWLVRASTLGETVTPDNVQATSSTKFGSANVQALRIDVATLFVQRAGFNIRENAYVFEADGFRSPNLSLHASEVTRSTAGGITRLAYQQEPDSIVWCLRADGSLVGLSYERDQDVVGFHLHPLGGFSNSAQTAAPVVESIATIPASDGSRDELWLAVQRYINGATVRTIEYMKPPLGENDDQEDAFYVDAGLTYDGSAVTTVTGATHLIGQTVRLLVNGASHPDKVVDSNGEVALDVAGSVVQLGLPYTSTLETMNLEAGAADGTAQTRTKRINKVFMRFHRTLGGKAGDSDTSLDDIPDTNFRNPATAMGSPPPLFSGDAEISWTGGYERDGRAVWQSSDPFPATIQALIPHVVTNPQ